MGTPSLVLFFPCPCFHFCRPWGEGRKKEGGGVTWYLLVAIPHPPVLSLPSLGMMGMLGTARRQGRFSAKIHTTQECRLEEGRFFKIEHVANHLVKLELHGSYSFCVRVVYFGGTTRIASQSNIVTESPNSCDTHQGVQRKRNAFVAFENYVKRATITFVSQNA